MGGESGGGIGRCDEDGGEGRSGEWVTIMHNLRFCNLFLLARAKWADPKTTREGAGETGAQGVGLGR